MKGIMKKAVFLAAAGMTALALSGCSAGSGGKRIVRISHAQSETHPEHLGLLAFKEYVEERLGDKYEVQIFPNELLGSAQKAIELTQTGAIDFVVAGTANLETFASVYEIFSMPYLFTSEDAYFAAMNDTDYMNKIYASTEDTGLQVVTWYNVGTRNFYAKKAINTPDDLKGLKIRIMENELQLAQWKAYGANPTPMAFTELFTALQQGTVDGQDNGAELTWQSKFQEVQKYYVYTKHIYSPYVILMSGETFNGLTPEEQDIIMKISDEAVAYERERCSEYEAVALENIKNYPGMNYAELSPEVVEEMKAACAGIKDLAYEKVEHPEVIDLLYSEAEKAKEKYPAEQTTDAPAQTEADAAPAA